MGRADGIRRDSVFTANAILRTDCVEALALCSGDDDTDTTCQGGSSCHNERWGNKRRFGAVLAVSKFDILHV